MTLLKKEHNQTNTYKSGLHCLIRFHYLFHSNKLFLNALLICRKTEEVVENPFSTLHLARSACMIIIHNMAIANIL